MLTQIKILYDWKGKRRIVTIIMDERIGVNDDVVFTRAQNLLIKSCGYKHPTIQDYRVTPIGPFIINNKVISKARGQAALKEGVKLLV